MLTQDTFLSVMKNPIAYRNTLSIILDERQFNIEMENHSDSDSVPKRARFYQGLIDTPILKSGRKTKYRQLPSTVISFITQDDIFKKDRAMYTFVEKCKEIIAKIAEKFSISKEKAEENLRKYW